MGAGNRVPARVMHSHNLLALWSRSRKWFQQNNYLIVDDDRLDKVDWMVENFNAVDPTGELFRFANSRLEAFGRSKTYDRAGFYMSVMVPLFEASYSFLTYWSGTLTQERFKREGLI